MPLRDHFALPFRAYWPWDGFNSAWANAIVAHLNQSLPPRFYAIAHIQRGTRFEIDVAMLEDQSNVGLARGGVQTAVWAPPKPPLVTPVDFTCADVFEVQVYYDEDGPRLVAAVELVSPANKNRPSYRRAFTIKCASYLQENVALVVIDVVTERQASFHAELMALIQGSAQAHWQSPTNLSAVAYRTLDAEQESRLEIWPESLAIGEELPTMPLWLGTDIALALDLEQTYQATCDTLRINGV